ncbi:hypothetical protein JCM3765_002124 [Sporobolomyces pararoseus]
MHVHPAVQLQPRPKRSLLILPPELLAAIVRRCSEQDEAFRYRVKILRQHPRISDDIRTILQIQESVGYGSSVNVLFRVCKTLSKLAAPYIFNTVKVSKAVSSPTYRYWVSKRRAQHFKRIVIDTISSLELDYFMASFDQFSNATELEFDVLSAYRLFGNLHSIPPAENLAWWFYKKSTTSITDLILDGFDFETTVASELIAACTNLRNLTLRLGRLPSSIDKVASFVASFPHLESLTIQQSQEEDEEGNLPDIPESFSQSEVDWPRLKKLSILSGELELNTIKFIQRFADSLEELSLETLMDHHIANFASPPILPASPIFPRLRKITTVKSSVVAHSIFSSTNQSTFPSLSRVRLSHYYNSSHGLGKEDRILNLLWAKHKFKVLEYVPPDSELFQEDVEFVHHKAEANQVKVIFGDYPQDLVPFTDLLYKFKEARDWSVSQWVKHDGPPDTTDLDCRQSQIDRIQAYIDETRMTAKLTGNEVKLDRLLLLLRPVEYDRLAKMD